MAQTKLHDILVVGGGPAGLGCTLATARLHRSVAMFDSGVYRNAQSDEMHTVVGVDGMKPSDWLARGRAQLAKNAAYGDWIDLVTRKVLEVKAVESPVRGQTRFALCDESGHQWLGRKVVLATGVTDELPDILGFKELWGKSIAHCVFCHGQELCQGPTAHLAVLLTADPSANAMLMHSLNNFSRLIPGKDVTILANGHFEHHASGLPAEAGLTSETLALLKARKTNFVYPAITAFKPTATGHTILFSTGTSLDVSGTLFAPPIRANNMFGLATPPKSILDSPTDLIAGVFIAGNAKTQYSGVSAAEADGVLAVAMGAAKELGVEDAAADVEVAAATSV